MKENINCGIYMIMIGNYYYYGSSRNLNNRRSSHICELKKKIHDNSIMQRCFSKHKQFSFGIIEFCKESDLVQKEQFYLDKYYKQKYCMNLARFADHPTRGVPMKETQKKKIKEFMKIRPPLSQETRQRISSKMKGKKLQQHVVESMSRPLIIIFADNTIKQYKSIKEAEIDLKVADTSIIRWINGIKPFPANYFRAIKKTKYIAGGYFIDNKEECLKQQEELIGQLKPKRILVVEFKNGNIQKFNSIRETQKILNIPYGSLSSWISNREICPGNDKSSSKYKDSGIVKIYWTKE